MSTQQVDSTMTNSPPQDSPKMIATTVAWWLFTGENDPALVTRFMYGTPENNRHLAHITAQVSRIRTAVAAAGIGVQFDAVLADLFQQPVIEQVPQ